MTLGPGFRLGPYEIVTPLGAGGMGEVYRARDTRLDRDVALKVLVAPAGQDSERFRRFRTEAQSAAALAHANIVAVYDIGEVDGTPYIVSELLPGGTLAPLLARGPLSIKKLLDLAIPIAEGLMAAHAQGIVHRDLKPDNILLSADGSPKISDFGLAKYFRPAHDEEGSQLMTLSDDNTKEGTIVGTIAYMSPEQATGQPVDFRSDQFSFGSLLYEMATGKRAFLRPTTVQTLAAIVQEEPEPIASLNAKVPAPLRWTVERCLAKDQRERYASTEDLARDLGTMRARLSEVSGAASAVAAPRGRGLAALRRPALWLAAVLAALLLGGIAARPLWAPQPAGPPTYRRLTFRRGNFAFGEGSGSARFAPDGQTIIYAAKWDGAPIELFSARLGSAEGRLLGLAAGTFLQSISSSGEMALELSSGESTLATAHLGGGEPRQILERVTGADWAPDGKSLAVTRYDPGKRPRLEFPIGRVLYQSAGYITHPRFSRAGDRIAFIDHPPIFGPSGSVVVVDLAGTAKVLSPGWQGIWGLAWSPKGDEIWFTAGDRATPRAIRAVSLSGRQRVLARAPGNLGLHDVSPDGRVLVDRTETTAEIFALAPGQTRERNISWLDRCILQDLSRDGTAVLCRQWGEGAGAIYLRKTDGSSAVQLGDGELGKFSPDGKRVLIATLGPPPKIVLLPTGAGEPRVVPNGGLEYEWSEFSWLPDGTRILFSARQANRPLRCYVQDIDGVAAAHPVTPEGISRCRLPSPDGKLVLSGDFESEQGGFLIPLDGGPPRKIPGLLPGEVPIQWSADGASLYAWKSDGQTGDRVYRIELGTGRRQFWREFEPADLAGTGRGGIDTILVTPDGKSYVYGYQRSLATLYLVEGLR